MIRVAGTDPGTSSLDMLLLEDGIVRDQCRFRPEELQRDVTAPVRWLQERGPLDLVAGPSGYGLPLVPGRQCGERELALMTLVRPSPAPEPLDREKGPPRGVVRFTSLLRAFLAASLPVVFLPGVIHLSTVPVHRKINRIDLGTADKLCVAALALAQQPPEHRTFAVVEMGSMFSAVVVVQDGQIVHGVGGTCGPPGWGSGGGWDGELAYLLSPLSKRDLSQGGSLDCPPEERLSVLREGLVQTVAGLQAVVPFHQILLAGRGLELQPNFTESLLQTLQPLGDIILLPALPGAWVKHAAQGAALLADGLAGGPWKGLVSDLRLRQAAGTVLDWLRHPRAAEVRQMFGI